MMKTFNHNRTGSFSPSPTSSSSFSPSPSRVQRNWWRQTAKILQKKAVEDPRGAESAAADLLERHLQAMEALRLLGGWLVSPYLVHRLFTDLELDVPSWRRQPDSIDALWVAAQTEARAIFGNHRPPMRSDYHPTLRAVWLGWETSAVSLVLRYVSRLPGSREMMSDLGWAFPPANASGEEFDAFFADVCESAAGPGLSASVSA